MQKDELVYIGHMFDMAQRAVNKIADLSRSDYDEDENLRLALTHLIQTIGEAACQVSPEFQQAHDAIPWRQITGMRHRVVHDYLHVDYDIVWDVVTVNLPPLIEQLHLLLPPVVSSRDDPASPESNQSSPPRNTPSA